jgi:hypothetical protein
LEKAIWIINEQLDFVKRYICCGKQRQCVVGGHKKTAISPKWTGLYVELVELVYALYKAGSLNDGSLSLKDLFAVFGELFGIEVKNFSRTFTDIKNRTKGDRTIYLDKLKSSLLQQLSEADEIKEKRK